MIIVLQAGQVAESGTHQQLVDRAGLYSELWSGVYSLNPFVFPWVLILTYNTAQETLFVDNGKDDTSEEPNPSKK
jgi:ABC transporter ATM